MDEDAGPKIGVGCFIVKGNKILFGKRKAAHGEGTWAPPGGHIEFKEDPRDAVIREVFEETGLKVESPRFAGVTNDVFLKENKHYITLIYVCKYLSGEPVVKEPEKM